MPRGQIPSGRRALRVIHVHIEERVQQKIYVDKCERAQRQAVRAINKPCFVEFMSKMQSKK